MTDIHESQTLWTFQDIAIEWYVRNHFLQTVPRFGWHNPDTASFFAPSVIWNARDVKEKAEYWVGERYVHPRYNHDHDPHLDNDDEYEPGVTLSEESMDQLFPRYEGTKEDLAIKLIRFVQMLLEHNSTRDGGHVGNRTLRGLANLRAAGRILVKTREDEGILACCAIPSSTTMSLSVFSLVLERAWKKPPSALAHPYHRGPSRVYYLLRNAAVLQDIIEGWKVPR